MRFAKCRRRTAAGRDDALEIYETIDIGVGTAVEGKGLVVPVVRDVQSLDLFGIARALSDLVARAREDKLTPADVRGGTFTISNHGVSGSLVATPIVINQPQSAILGVGKLEKRAVVVDENGTDAIVVRPRCYVTLTLDHRVMDGHRANRFLQVLVERLESLAKRRPERVADSADSLRQAAEAREHFGGRRRQRTVERLHARRQELLRRCKDLRVEIAAQCVRVGAGPLARQERCRQLRIAQMDLAILVHEQRAQHERCFAGRVAPSGSAPRRAARTSRRSVDSDAPARRGPSPSRPVARSTRASTTAR